MTKYGVNEVRRGLYRGDRSMNGYQTCHLAELVDIDKYNRQILTTGRKPKDEVDRNRMQCSAAIGGGCKGACDDGDDYTFAGKFCSYEFSCAPTYACGARINHET